MKKFDVIIGGAGFAGIYAAWRLAKSGCSVALLEAENGIGGNLNSRQWGKFWLDNGTHNFDMRTKLGNDFFQDIMGDDLQIWTEPYWASTMNKSWSHGFEMPDLSKENPTLAAQALTELQKIKKEWRSDINSESYIESYRQSYGPTLTATTLRLVKKFTGSDPTCLSAEAGQSLGIFDRPKLGTDKEMITFKKSDPFWDKRLGVSLLSDDNKFSGKSIKFKVGYPKKRGLMGFCINAQRRLEELGVQIKLGHKIDNIENDRAGIYVTAENTRFSAKKIFWSLSEIGLSKVLGTGIDFTQDFIPVGTCLFAFEVSEKDVKGPGYLHDFHPERACFRYNKMGVYSQQVHSKGNTIVMAEVPSHPVDIPKNTTLNMSKVVWQNICDSEFVRPIDQPIASTCWGLPVAFTLPRIGWRSNFIKLQEMINNKLPDLHFIGFGPRGRTSYMSYYDRNLHDFLQN
ncbi:MAG: NAD(P)-binding protein [Planktomarina sp.]|nr:NAD(P)-binding protein [Planktomarina sp.]